MTWKRWISSLFNAAINGASTAFLSNGLGASWSFTLKLAGSTALVSAVKWYLQHPPPGLEEDKPKEGQ